MADFILVHGGLHGAWCWDKLQPELAKLGHTSTAMDLPVDRVGAEIDDYVETVLSHARANGAGDAYLVGHSMGGLIVPRVAAARPQSRIIFLCAGFAHASEAERLENMGSTDTDVFFSRLKADALGRMTMSTEDAISAFFHDVPPDLAQWAAARLRPQWPDGYAEVGPIAPYAERVAGIIDCRDDRIIRAEPHRALALTRFGIEPRLLPGGHSPFLSCPAELADALDAIVRADRDGRS